MAAVLVILDTHVKYAIYVNSSSSSSSTSLSTTHIYHEGDPTDTTKYQLQLLLRIFLLSVLEHLVFIGVVMGLALWRLAVARRRRRSERQGREGKEGPQPQQTIQQTRPPSSPLPPPVSAAPLSLVGRKLMQGLTYPEFGRLVVVFVMIWDNSISVSNLIGLLVLSSQWQALRAVMGVAAVAAGEREDEGKEKEKEEEGWRIEAELAAFPFLFALACKCLLRLAVYHLDAAAVNLWLV